MGKFLSVTFSVQACLFDGFISVNRLVQFFGEEAAPEYRAAFGTKQYNSGKDRAAINSAGNEFSVNFQNY